MSDVDAGRDLEELEGELGRATEAARGITKHARVAPGVSNQLLHRIDGQRRAADEDERRRNQERDRGERLFGIEW